tara:strand:- start:739 stop:927 length:189 start_codon:yes stop_codon:yes gene_type:complete
MDNPFEAWGKAEPQRDVYPEPPPDEPSKLELTNNLLDALLTALDKGNKEEIEAIKEQLKELK